jgi:hypothetical protein
MGLTFIMTAICGTSRIEKPSLPQIHTPYDDYES